MEEISAAQENQSDSDSSESWTFVDDKAIPKIDYPCHEVTSTCDGNTQEKVSKCNGDEENDTDGVAVITDDEEVSSTTRETTPLDEVNEALKISGTYLHNQSRELFFSGKKNYNDLETSCTATFRDSEEELVDEFCAKTGKIKSYVHKRNNKVSTLLNIILLGTLVTAATLAVGFMWGIHDTCSLDVLDSVNNILANLQKLQQENEMLRTKIKLLQSMKYNKPIKNDIEFEKFFQMQFDNNVNIPLPPQEKSNELKNSGGIQIILERSLDNHFVGQTDNVKDKLNKMGDLKDFNINFVDQSDIKNFKEDKTKENAKYENQSLNMDGSEVVVEDVNIEFEVPKYKSKNERKSEKHRNKREIKKFKTVTKHESTQTTETKPFCEDSVDASGQKTECSSTFESNSAQDLKKNASLEREKRKKDKRSKKSIKQNKKNKTNSSYNSDSDTYSNGKEDLSQQKHFNDNINSDWYHRMYDGRKEIREKGVDDYDLMDMKNRAKWYFKRMHDREKSRFDENGKITVNRKFQRREYFRSKR